MSREKIIEIARDTYENAGEIEIDDDAEIRHTSEGIWVSARVCIVLEPGEENA